MAKQVLDLEEWELVLSKMHRHHANIQEEVAVIVQTIRKEMKSDLVPLAEEKANYGKVWCTDGVVHFYNEMSYSCGRNSCYIYLVLELNCHGTQSPEMKKVYYMGK